MDILEVIGYDNNRNFVGLIKTLSNCDVFCFFI